VSNCHWLSREDHQAGHRTGWHGGIRMPNPAVSRRSFLAATATTMTTTMLDKPARAATSHAPAMPHSADEPASLTLRVNGHDFRVALDTRAALLDTLREHLGLTGTKKG